MHTTPKHMEFTIPSYDSTVLAPTAYSVDTWQLRKLSLHVSALSLLVDMFKLEPPFALENFLLLCQDAHLFRFDCLRLWEKVACEI